MGTLFASVYNRFLGKITDDMYLEITPQETLNDLQNLLIDAIPGFEFPRKSLEYTISQRPLGDSPIGFVREDIEDTSCFTEELDSEEINILAILMMTSWLQRQITSIENIRMKYSGTDFKMTSQANHIAKLLSLIKETQRQSHHMQRLYKRRTGYSTNQIRSNWYIFRENTVIPLNNSSYEELEEEEDSHWDDF